MNTLKIIVTAKKPKRSTEELIQAAKEKDARVFRGRKTPTKEQKATALLNAMINYEETAQSVDDVDVETPKGEWDVKIGDPIEFFDPALSYELTGYRPITKDLGLDFNPKLFTEAADSFRKNKRYTLYAPGTFKNKLFWTLEWDRCINGCTIGKYRLTGLNYFWLNYYRLESNISDEASDELVRIEDFPGFLAKQYEYFHYLELVKLLKKDALVFKARGVGVSEVAASNTVHLYTFYKESSGLITAFIEDYVRATLAKCWLQLNFLNMYTDGEFRHVRMKLDTDMHKRASKVDRDKNESGWMSEIKGITHDSPRKLRGFRVNSIVFEEAGSDGVLEKTYILAEALVRVGGKRIGYRLVQGTGGDSGKELASIQKMFYNPKGFKILPYKNTYGLDKLIQFTGYFIPAYTMWFGDDEGNIGFDSRGVVDEERAKEYFIKGFEEYEDLYSLLTARAEYCFTPEDAFILEGSNRFDLELLVDLYNNITIHKCILGPQSARLIWDATDDEGHIDKSKRPRIEFVPDSALKIIELPKLDPDGVVFKNLYVIGIDAIDVDSTTSTGQTDVSKFCAIVYKRSFGIDPPKPVAIYKERPLHILIAFDNALKLCSFYNAQALVEATRISIKLYFEKEHMLHYMMRRPQATANSSKKTNFKQYGVPATEAIIQHLLDLIEQYIVDYSTEIQFPDMLDELIKYSYENKRKFDIVAAFGIALLADEDMIGKTAKAQTIAKENYLNLSYYKNDYGQIEFGVQSGTTRREDPPNDMWSLW